MRKKIKQVVGILLSLVLAIGLMPGMSMTAKAEEKTESFTFGEKGEWSFSVDEAGNPLKEFEGVYFYGIGEHFTKVTDNTTELSDDGHMNWYVVDKNTIISSRLKITGTVVRLLLCDGVTLRVPKGIDADSLEIYGQWANTGKLIIDDVDSEKAGIDCRNIEISGGNVTVKGGQGKAGIYAYNNTKVSRSRVFAEGGGVGVEAIGSPTAFSGQQDDERIQFGEHMRVYEGEDSTGELINPGAFAYTYSDTVPQKLYAEYEGHHFVYELSNGGATLKAYCKEGCSQTSEEKPVEVTINAPKYKQFGRDHEWDAQEATYVTNDNHEQAWGLFSIIDDDGNYVDGRYESISKIKYFATDQEGNRTGEELRFAPEVPGTYWAGFIFDENNDQANPHVVYTIDKAEASTFVPTGIKAKYGDTLEDVELPETSWSEGVMLGGSFAWEEPTLSVGDLGEHEFYAKFVPYLPDWVKEKRNIPVTVTVEKADPADENIGKTTFEKNTNSPEVIGVILEDVNKELAKIAGEDKTETGDNEKKDVTVTMETKVVTETDVTKKEVSAIKLIANKKIPAADKESLKISYLDFKINQNVAIYELDSNGMPLPDAKTNTNKTLSELKKAIDIPVQYDLTDLHNLQLVRYHGEKAESFRRIYEKPDPDALQDLTFFVEGKDADAIVHIYTKEFSTYALITSGTEEYKNESSTTTPTESTEPTTKDESVTVYRLYYVPTKEHFYTTDAYERSVLISK
uniref:hypothetical protein n=1 Tax=Eubacterium cellulosolvens TaxID=29322 RepID=UPI0012DC599A